LRKKEAKLLRMKETRAAEETMLASMVLSERGAWTLENAVANAQLRVSRKKQAERDADAARPSVFVEPCDVCLALREVLSKSNKASTHNESDRKIAHTKLCSRCQVKARDLAAAEVKKLRAAAKEKAEDLADALRRGEPPVKDAATLAREEKARIERKKSMRDPRNVKRGYDDLEKDLRRTERSVALANTPETRVAALHRCSQLRVAMETARREREVEMRRRRMLENKEGFSSLKNADEDERWLTA